MASLALPLVWFEVRWSVVVCCAKVWLLDHVTGHVHVRVVMSLWPNRARFLM